MQHPKSDKNLGIEKLNRFNELGLYLEFVTFYFKIFLSNLNL